MGKMVSCILNCFQCSSDSIFIWYGSQLQFEIFAYVKDCPKINIPIKTSYRISENYIRANAAYYFFSSCNSSFY